jgi:hypothetical protein
VATDNGAAKATNSVNIIVDAPPTVSLTSPTNNATYIAPAALSIAAAASDTDGTVSMVQFFAGTNRLGQAISPPYSLIWSNPPLGSYVLTARATDDLGVIAASSPVDITIIKLTPAAVSLLNPEISNGRFQCSFQTQTGVSYTVQFTDSVDTINWQTLTNLIGDGSLTSITDPNSIAAERFYRITAQ